MLLPQTRVTSTLPAAFDKHIPKPHIRQTLEGPVTHTQTWCSMVLCQEAACKSHISDKEKQIDNTFAFLEKTKSHTNCSGPMTDIMLLEVLENTGEKYPQFHSTLLGIKKQIHPYLSQRFFSACDNALDTSLQSPGARHNPCPTTTMSNR